MQISCSCSAVFYSHSDLDHNFSQDLLIAFRIGSVTSLILTCHVIHILSFLCPSFAKSWIRHCSGGSRREPWGHGSTGALGAREHWGHGSTGGTGALGAREHWGLVPPVWGNFLLRDLIHQSHWYVLLKFNKTKKLRRLFKSESTESNKSRHLDLLPSMHLKIPACGCAHAHGTSRVIARGSWTHGVYQTQTVIIDRIPF